jgi:hypothetical protein
MVLLCLDVLSRQRSRLDHPFAATHRRKCGQSKLGTTLALSPSCWPSRDKISGKRTARLPILQDGTREPLTRGTPEHGTFNGEFLSLAEAMCTGPRFRLPEDDA